MLAAVGVEATSGEEVVGKSMTIAYRGRGETGAAVGKSVPIGYCGRGKAGATVGGLAPIGCHAKARQHPW